MQGQRSAGGIPRFFTALATTVGVSVRFSVKRAGGYMHRFVSNHLSIANTGEAPVRIYATEEDFVDDGARIVPISGAVVASNVLTVDVPEGHNVVVGRLAQVAGLSSGFNIAVSVEVSAVTKNTVSLPLTHADGSPADETGTLVLDPIAPEPGPWIELQAADSNGQGGGYLSEPWRVNRVFARGNGDDSSIKVLACEGPPGNV